jgi:hypothetical protein
MDYWASTCCSNMAIGIHIRRKKGAAFLQPSFVVVVNIIVGTLLPSKKGLDKPHWDIVRCKSCGIEGTEVILVAKLCLLDNPRALSCSFA